MSKLELTLPRIKEIEIVGTSESPIPYELQSLQESYNYLQQKIIEFNLLLNKNETSNLNQFKSLVNDFLESFVNKDLNYDYKLTSETILKFLPKVLILTDKDLLESRQKISITSSFFTALRSFLSSYNNYLFHTFNFSFENIDKHLTFLLKFYSESYMIILNDGTLFKHFLGEIADIEYYVNNHLVIQSKLPYLYTYQRLLKYNKIDGFNEEFRFKKLNGALNSLIEEYYDSQKNEAIIDFVDNNSNVVLDFYVLAVYKLLLIKLDVGFTSQDFYNFSISGKNLSLQHKSSKIKINSIYKALVEIEKKGHIQMNDKLIENVDFATIKKRSENYIKDILSITTFNEFLSELNYLESRMKV